MRLKTLLIACLCMMLTVPAMAEFYGSVGAGIVKNTGSILKNSSKEDMKTSMAYSMAFGYDLPFIDIVRVEGEFLHNRSKIKNGMGFINMDALMGNAYVDIPFILPLLTPYVGAGIGYGRLENSNAMPMQLMLGMDGEIFVIPMIASLEYRYLQANRSAKSANEKDKYYAHMLMLKLRYEF